MSFGKPRFNKLADYELIRFCTISDTVVHGAFSKLLSAFMNENPTASVLSYANCAWSVGDIYEKNKFSLVGHSSPNFWWTNGKVMIPRYQTQKKKLIKKYGSDLVKSEDDFMRNHMKMNKYYDAGNLVYKKGGE